MVLTIRRRRLQGYNNNAISKNVCVCCFIPANSKFHLPVELPHNSAAADGTHRKTAIV